MLQVTSYKDVLPPIYSLSSDVYGFRDCGHLAHECFITANAGSPSQSCLIQFTLAAKYCNRQIHTGRRRRMVKNGNLFVMQQSLTSTIA